MTRAELHLRGDTAHILFRRESGVNLLDAETAEDLARALGEALARPGLRGIVLEAEGKAFLAGADVSFFLGRMREGDAAGIAAFTRRWHAVLDALEASPVPVVAAVNGLCPGGGAELVLACRAVVAGPRARFAFPETSLGIRPGLGGIARLSRIVGKPLAKCLVLTGRSFDGREAQELGLAFRLAGEGEDVSELAAAVARGEHGSLPDRYAPGPVHPAWRAQAELFSDAGIGAVLGPEGAPRSAEAEQARRMLAANAPLAVAEANRLFDEGERLSLREALELELGRLPGLFSTRDAWEGLSSLGKNRPAFRGE